MENKLEKEALLKKSWVVCVLALACCLLWGSAFPCVKVGYSLFNIAREDIPSQILFAGLRFVLAGVLAIFIGSVLNKKALVPQKSSWTMVLKLSLVQTVLQYLLFYIGLANTTGVKSSIIEASNVFFAIIISALAFKQEKLGSKKLLGCLLGFMGVVIINLSGGLDASFSLMGEGAILLSALSYGFSSVLIKSYSQRESPVTLSGYQFLIGGLVMTAIALAFGGRLSSFSLRGVLLLVYMAIISAVAYSLWGILLKYNPVGRVTVYGFMNPVFGVILSAVILKENSSAFSLRGIVALALVSAGIYMVNKDKS